MCVWVKRGQGVEVEEVNRSIQFCGRNLSGKIVENKVYREAPALQHIQEFTEQ